MRRPPLTDDEMQTAARSLAALHELPAHVVEPRGRPAVLRRPRVEGFVAPDGRTHAVALEPRTHRRSVVSRCDQRATAGAAFVVPFIANPQHPLCYGCVSAIEDEIRGEKE